MRPSKVHGTPLHSFKSTLLGNWLNLMFSVKDRGNHHKSFRGTTKYRGKTVFLGKVVNFYNALYCLSFNVFWIYIPNCWTTFCLWQIYEVSSSLSFSGLWRTHEESLLLGDKGVGVCIRVQLMVGQKKS